MLRFFRNRDKIQPGAFGVVGVGMDEPMQPAIVDRPGGTGDWLLMYFNNPAWIQTAGQRREYPAGSFVIWSPREGHYYGNAESNWSHSWIHCLGLAVEGIIAEAGLEADTVYSSAQGDVFADDLLPIYREITDQARPDDVILQNLFQNMIHRIARGVDHSARQLAIPARLTRARRYLDRHFDEKQTLQSLAQQVSLSVPYLCAGFKKHFGQPPIDYLIHVRMLRAHYLLHDRNLSVSEIAIRVGYDDLFYFSKLFKKHFGASPRKLREKF